MCRIIAFYRFWGTTLPTFFLGGGGGIFFFGGGLGRV